MCVFSAWQSRPWLVCCAEAWTRLLLGQGKHHPQAPPDLPTDLDGFFLPTVHAAPCPPQLTVTHHTPLVFTVVSTLKENSLLRGLLSCALLFWKAVFPLAKSTRVVPRGHGGVSFSFWPLPRGCRRPPPARGEVLRPDTRLQQPPAPASDKCQSSLNPFQPSSAYRCSCELLRQFYWEPEQI